MTHSEASYPRPDFVRQPLQWESLNGGWDFLFDDDDVGLTRQWQLSGLPTEVTVAGTLDHQSADAGEGEAVTRRIVGDTQQLIEDNTLSRSKDASTHKLREIKVPFVFQSPASGINDRNVHEVLWYQRSIKDLRTLEQKKAGHRLLVRFGAVDYHAQVWLDGQFVGEHRGGHVPFELDVTDQVSGQGAEIATESSHRLSVRVYDSAYDLTQPRGKQYWGAKPESIFYTPSGGIWQSVWLEVVPPTRLGDSSQGTLLRSNDPASGVINGFVSVVGRRAGQRCYVELESSLHGVAVDKMTPVEVPRETAYVKVELKVKLDEAKKEAVRESSQQLTAYGNDSWHDGVALWSPEHPTLYDVTIRLLGEKQETLDEVQTTAGMRSIDWTTGDGLWRLNGKPYFQALCLDQGYWPDTLMTPPSQQHLKADIEMAKAMGFNGCRKHQKVEDPAFYYWADKLGYLVWGEMANAYQFSQEYTDRFDQEWTESVKLAINHPCVVTWTPANESWGYTSLSDNVDHRNHLRSLYYLTKNLDPTRSINENCGWEHVQTDLTTFHDYADGPELAKTCADLNLILGLKAGRQLFVPEIPGKDAASKHLPGAPIMCTEFGGVNIAMLKDSEQGGDGGWGYTTASDPADLMKRVETLVKAVVEGGHCCAFVYTQFSDIEQETNGLYTFDRKPKLEPAKVKAMLESILATFYDRVSQRKSA